VREFLASKQIAVLVHPPYSPDLAPSGFFVLLNIREIMKIRAFDDTDDIRCYTTAVLKAIPQNQFQNCFEGWTRRWNWCTTSEGSTLKATTVICSNEVM
jgi:transposase